MHDLKQVALWAGAVLAVVAFVFFVVGSVVAENTKTKQCDATCSGETEGVLTSSGRCVCAGLGVTRCHKGGAGAAVPIVIQAPR